MIQEIPELKAMINCGKRFLTHKSTIHELHGHAQQLKIAVGLFDSSKAIGDLAEEWITMTYRHWNEWGDVKEPLSKEEFKAWLSKQIKLL